MKKSRYTEAQTLSILKEGEAGIRVGELCRKYVIGHITYYKWKAKYGGLELSDMRRLKQLEEEIIA